MQKSLASTLLFVSIAFGQYKSEPAGPPPAELAAPVREALQKDGAKVVASDGSVFCEVWFRTTAPSGAATTEQGASLTTIPHGALLGALRFSKAGQDRRGQTIKAGVYTLRYSLYPPDGNHQGVASQRDFLLLVPAANDSDLNSTPAYEDLVKMSGKAAGGPHPAVLSLWKDDAGHAPGLAQEGEDWVLHTKIGDISVAVTLVGAYQG